MNRDNLRTMTRGTYDMQKLRIQLGNRVVANFKAKLGQAPSRPEEEIDAEGKAILAKLRLSYARITDGVARFPTAAKFTSDGVIDSYTELCLVSEYIEMEDTEARHFKHLEQALRDFPIYTEFLSKVKGIGPALAAVIVSEIDISRSPRPSNLWSYCGLDVAKDGAGRSRREEHLVKRTYIDREGKEKVRNSITFNPFLKTKLMGVLGPSFLRQANPVYRPIYDGYKHRIKTNPAAAELRPAQIHMRCVRYMVKMFLLDLYKFWRELEGLPCPPSYHEGIQGHVHKGEAA